MVEAGAKRSAGRKNVTKQWSGAASNLKPALDLIKKVQKEVGQEKEAAPVEAMTTDVDDNIERARARKRCANLSFDQCRRK